MSLLILRAVAHLPNAPLSLPLTISFGFRNVLAPRFGMCEIELDSTHLLELLLTVFTFRYVRKLNLYVPSLNALMQAKTLPRIAATCVYLEELSLVIVFVSARRVLLKEHFDGINIMGRLEYLRIASPYIMPFSMLSAIAPPNLRTYVCGNAVFASNLSEVSYFSELPRSLTSLDISNVRVNFDNALAKLADLPPRLKNINLTRCGLTCARSKYDFSLLPRYLENARLSNSAWGVGLEGRNWHLFPELLINLDLSSCSLCDVLTDELTQLPVYLRTLILRDNKFSTKQEGDGIESSSLNLTLPSTLVELDISHNIELKGAINFHQLPEGLRIFRARGCGFTQSLTEAPKLNRGMTCLADLPRSLRVLDLSRTGVTTNGTTSLLFADLPPNLETIDLSFTKIRGYINFTLLPQSLRSITIYEGNSSKYPNAYDPREQIRIYDVDATIEEQQEQQLAHSRHFDQLFKRRVFTYSDLPEGFED